LDESLQDTFAAFLAERGVDESLCKSTIGIKDDLLMSLANFIISFAEYKEQKDYVSWLADAKAFVEQ
jgi:complement component 1 Q subcomponent-binding protein